MVDTYEFRDGQLVSLGRGATLEAASETLPAGSYTTLRTYRGDRLLRLDRHVQRLEESARQLGAAAAVLRADEVSRAIALALAVTAHSESRLRLTWSPPRLFVSVEPFEPPPARLYRDGVWCVTVALQRGHPHAKDSRFVATAARVYERLPAGVHEGLMVAEDGALLEGLSSNFFAVAEGVLRTEHERVLQGVTRSLLLDVARDLLPVSPSPVHLKELPSLRDAFLTSVSRGIVPVVRIDEQTLGDGKPGPLTLELMRRFAEHAEREAVRV